MNSLINALLMHSKANNMKNFLFVFYLAGIGSLFFGCQKVAEQFIQDTFFV